ncbi:MAG: hypothetical protein AAGF01_06640 [Cyanobacteria bacterium P01_G01_bin.38]
MNEQQRQLRRAAAEEFMQSLDQLEMLLSEDAIEEGATPSKDNKLNSDSDSKKSNFSEGPPRPGQPPQAR